MSTTFDPNQPHLSGIELIAEGTPETEASRIEFAKERFRDEISRRIPPAFRDQIRWVVDRVARVVRWEYPGR